MFSNLKSNGQKNNRVDCCVIKAEVFSDSNRINSKDSFGYVYNVPVAKIEEARRFIKATFEYFGIPCSRVYISGFAIVSENSLWNKERIVEQVNREAKKIKALFEEKHNVMTR